MSEHAEFLRSWAADIRASSGQSVDADRLDAIAAEITRLQKEIETAREALEDIASDKLRDDTWPEHYWRLVEVARRALKDKEVAG